MTSIESDPVSRQPLGQIKRCSRIPLYVLWLLLAVFLIITYFDFTSDVEGFIKQTGGQLCFAYSSIEIYRAIFLIEDGVVAIGAVAIWVMIRAGYCRLSRITFIFVLALLFARWHWVMGNCAP